MKRRLCVTGLFVLFVGCAEKPQLSADEYFQQGNTFFREEALGAAIEHYRDLLDQYPFSEYNEEAELKIAHAQYLEGNYTEAVVALTDFQRRHPTSPNLPFVGYYLGMCYVRQAGTIDRDQTAAQNAQTYFVTVSRQYPDSPFAELAKEQLARCREDLGRHELYIADYYTRRGNSKAAEIRLIELASQYGDTDAAADGLMRLGQLYAESEQPDHAILAYRALARLHPGTTYAVDAQRQLQNLSAGASTLDSDPLDLLLAANGRQRAPTALETVQLPGIDLPKVSKRPTGAPGPAFGPNFDPFGRGRSYY
ncbi:MAG TPA: outer membrane protein assembly factor BamD [Candidatus Acidoferrales bacterium]|nr:outer membrane protein assembly factor BamD [Candidatus Acidoferrales bacterium]